MATRPPPRGGLTPIHYWFIVFVGLWLISTVLLVILYTDQSKLKQEARQWRDEKSLVVRPNEEIQLRAWREKAGAQRSFVGVLNDERAEAVRLIAGDAAADLATGRTLLGEVLSRVASEKKVTDPALYTPETDLVTLLRRLYEDYVKTADLLASVKAENDELKREDLKRMQASADEKRQFQEAAAELEQRVETLRQDYDGSVGQRQEQISRLTESLAGLREEASSEQRRMQEQNEQLDEQVLKLARIIINMRQQRERLYEADPTALLRQMDGEIIDINMPAGIAYIDLGRNDRVIAGLAFEVYPPDGRINADGSGKGALEVVGMGPDTAECRITRSRLDDPITVGDLVGNVVYDKRKTYKFAVVGGFDINGDGRPDDGGTEVIRAIVQDWGGAVADDVDETTDFVVVGSEPNRPLLPEEATPEEKARAAEQIEVYDHYTRVRDQARMLAVPLLTQTQFFNLLGFSGNVVRGSPLARR